MVLQYPPALEVVPKASEQVTSSNTGEADLRISQPPMGQICAVIDDGILKVVR